MNPDELRSLIEDAVRKAVQPLEQQINALRLELQTLKSPSRMASGVAESAVQEAVPNQPAQPAPADQTPSQSPSQTAIPVVPMPEINTEVPAERTDFARFLQRGLEQETHDYSEENLREEAPKKRGGWNPFKR